MVYGEKLYCGKLLIEINQWLQDIMGNWKWESAGKLWSCQNGIETTASVKI